MRTCVSIIIASLLVAPMLSAPAIAQVAAPGGDIILTSVLPMPVMGAYGVAEASDACGVAEAADVCGEAEAADVCCEAEATDVCCAPPCDLGTYGCCQATDVCCQPPCDLGTYACCPTWTFKAGTLLMKRSSPDDAALVTEDGQGGTTVLLDASDFDFDFRGGWELSAIRHNVCCSCWDLEGRYFRIDGWRAVWGPVPTSVGAETGSISATYDSHLDGAELNLRCPVGCGWLTVLAGFRFLELDERGLSIGYAADPDSYLISVTHDVGVINDLYGFQLGADGRLWECGCLSVDALARAGIYGNEAASTIERIQTNQDMTAAIWVRASDSHTAFLGEVGLTATCQLTECLALRAGYQLMWLEGVAVASEQPAFSDPLDGIPTVDTSGSPFYHGVVITLESVW